MPFIVVPIAVGLAIAFPEMAAATAIAIATGIVIVGATALLIGGTILLGKLFAPKKTATNANTLSQNTDPNAFRIMVLGQFAAGNDVRYWEVYGAAGYDEVIAAATHKITSFGDFYIEGAKVSFSGATATGITNSDGTTATTYSGQLKKYNSTVGVSGASPFSVPVGAGSLWTTNCSMTGLASYLLRWTYDQNKLPSIPSRTVQIIKGSPVYDPRKDSTNGGSGSHRANDNTTWEYTPTDSNGIEIGRNNALQMLRYLLGWYITVSGVATLVDGWGIDPNDIDFSSFITAANVCETEGYYTDCALSTGDSHNSNTSLIANGAQGVLLDTGGLWSYHPATNDTASIAVAFIDDDIIGPVTWQPKDTIANLYNQYGGNFIDTSATSVYQAAPYPYVTDSSYVTADGTAKYQTLDFANVTSPSLAQKLARIALNRNRLTGVFTGTFNFKALQANNYECVTLTFAALGWSAKLFRITSMAIDPIGGVALTLQEEDASVYSGGTIASYATSVSGIVYNRFQQIDIGVITLGTVELSDPTTSTAYDGITVSWSALPANVSSVEINYKKTSDSSYVILAAIAPENTEVVIPNVLPATEYIVAARTWSIDGVPGPWETAIITTGTYTTATSNQTYQQSTDPSGTYTVLDGAFWADTTHSVLKMRVGGVWVQVADITGPVADGTVLYSSGGATGSLSFTIPSTGLAYVWIEGWGPDGQDHLTATTEYDKDGYPIGTYYTVDYTGGSGQYFKHHVGVTPGSTSISFSIPGFGTGSNTTVSTYSLTAYHGSNASSSANGAGGTGSTGANITTTDGTAGAEAGANGKIIITAKSS
jgi:hypothetical protein